MDWPEIECLEDDGNRIDGPQTQVDLIRWVPCRQFSFRLEPIL